MRILVYYAFFIALSASAHLIVGVWLKRAFSLGRKATRLVLGVSVLFVLLVPIARAVALKAQGGVGAALHAVAMLELMAVMFTAVPLGLLLAWRLVKARIVPRVCELLARRTPDGAGAEPASSIATQSTPGGAATRPAPAAALVTRRRALEQFAGVGFLAGTGTMLGWGMLRGRYDYTIEEVVVRIPNLPRTLEGYTIAQISDLHVGPFVGEKELATGLARVREARPDLIVATGDLVDYDPRFIDQMARALASVAPAARDGMKAILGNHDYYTGAGQIRRAVEAAGIDMLVNAHQIVRPKDRGGIALVGIDDLFARRFGGEGVNFERAVSDIPEGVPQILLAHQPRYFRYASGLVALQLSGHTHGGQINPGFSPARYLMKYVQGRYEEEGSTLWVNRGFGVAGPPSRVGAPPEVTKVVLVGA